MCFSGHNLDTNGMTFSTPDRDVDDVKTTREIQLKNKNMINFSRGSTTIAILLLATTAYGQCDNNMH